MKSLGYGYNTASERARKRSLRALIFGGLIYLLYLPFWWAITDMALMGFDLSGEGHIGAGLWLFIGYQLLYPAGVLLSLIGGWIAFARGRQSIARRWNTLPLLWILPVAIYLIVTNVL